MKKQQYWVLSLLSGLLLFGAWPVSPLCMLIFIALVPLLVLVEKVQKPLSFLGYVFVSLLIFNAATTWWIWNSTDIGSVAAIVANSLLMCLPWCGFYWVMKRQGRLMGYFALGSFWMLFEYAHLNWQLSWPWLTLGNVFASSTQWIQWYEFTGVAGGTLWILLANMLVRIVIGRWVLQSKQRWPWLIALSVAIALPISISLLLAKKQPKAEMPSGNVVMVQANINPYEKFDESNTLNELNHLIALSEAALDSNTHLVVWPETAMSHPVWQNYLWRDSFYAPVFQWLQKHPKLSLLSGIESFKNYGPLKATTSAHKDGSGVNYYDAFNTAILLHQTDTAQLYNKSKLVPGVESMPTFLNFLAPVFEQFGGTTGGYGSSESSRVFRVAGNPYQIAPVICYESIYGEYVSTYVKKGANMVAIITNDGWWGNTPGHKQHLQYARLRAIETRRWIARSANTGISAVIDDYGNIITTQPWDKAATIKYPIPTSNYISFYVANGDYLYKAACLMAALIAGWGLLFGRKKRRTKP